MAFYREVHPLSLMLVDDEIPFRDAIARRLSKRGLNPVLAASGEECLALMENRPAGIVILDVKMPGMDGLQTLKAIKQANPETQVILLTGNASVSDGVTGIKSGAFDYLTKPVEIEHLTAKIRQAAEMIRLAAEKKREQEYRRKMEKKMIDTERLISLGTMSTGIAHEINNPLAVINESAGLIKHILVSDPDSRLPKRDTLMMAVEKIEKSVKRARKITHQLLGHVKKNQNAISLTDPILLLEETLGLLEKETADKKIRIEWNQKPSTCRLYSDPYQIRQVLINLLKNAIDAVGENGCIVISVSETTESVTLEIKDNGMGIPKENLGKIFDPFFTTKPVDQGTGLGLFVVHKILGSLGADIEVASDVGKGTTFTVRLLKNAQNPE